MQKLRIALSGYLLGLAVIADTWAGTGHMVIWGHFPTGKIYNAQVPTTVCGEVTNVASVVASLGHVLVLQADGSVLGWGINNRGQVIGAASETRITCLEPVRVNGIRLTNAVAIAAGWTFSLALLDTGRVVGWGTEIHGEPLVVAPEATNLISIASGWRYRVGVTKEGELLDLWSGKTISGRSNIQMATIQTGDHPMGVALQQDQTLTLFATEGKPREAIKLPPLENITQIACGGAFNLALNQSGEVFGWGSNGGGQATGIPAEPHWNAWSAGSVHIGESKLTDVVAIAAGDHHGLALRKDGSVASWGGGRGQALEVPAGLSNVVAIAAGGNFSVAITTNATVAERFRR